MTDSSIPNDESLSSTSPKLQLQSPFLDPTVAGKYEAWYTGPGEQSDRLEKRLLKRLLANFPDARTILEVGCGTGHFTRWFAETGLTATGLDSSPAMLEVAREAGGPEYLLGDATSLSFPDGHFDLSAMITTLEFVPDPVRALTEVDRVARMGVLLGVLNSHSVLAWRYRRSGKATWKAARFFNVRELLGLVRRAFGPRIESMAWRTTLWPLPWITDWPLPWGGLIGVGVRLKPAPQDEGKSA